MLKKCDQNTILHSLPFITYSHQGGYQIQQKAIQFLRSLPDQDDYSIITIVGKSKTGKSFLMNQLADNPIMFPVSNSIQNNYHGIRIGTDLQTHENRKIIMLDVEGFGSIQGNDDRDCKLFVLAILLSSVIIYNSSGTIDEQSLNNLSLVIEIGKILEKELVNPGFFPSLFWVLRDFSLKMEDKLGYQITPNQYLENALEEQKGESQITFQKNRIRRIIKTLFSERKCETLVLPTQQINLNTDNTCNLRKQFIQDFNRFKQKLMTMIKKKGCKEICGVKMTRDSFIDAAKIYIQTLNRSMKEGNMPKIENITFKLKQCQTKSYITKFNIFLDEKKQQLLQRLIAIKKQNEKSKNKSDLLQSYQKTLQPIQNFYETTRKNIHQLTGEWINQGQLERIKKLFYQSIQKQSEQIIQIENHTQSQNIKQFIGDEEQELRIANICQFFTHISDQNQLQKEYFNEIKQMRSRHVNKNTTYFSNLLMKLQIAFLRRKVQLSKQNNLRVQQLQIQLKYSQKQVQNLTKRNRQLETQLLSHARESRNKSYLTPNKNSYNSSYQNEQSSKIKNRQNSTYSKIHKENNFASNSKVQSLSFYIPYVTIQKFEYLTAKIVRTLIKQDSRRNSYIEYVLQVNLLDQKWVLNRKFKDFSQLHSILIMMYQGIKLPQCQAITGCVRMMQQNPQLRKQIVQMRRKQLENYMYELIEMQGIRNSRIFQKFLKINKEYTLL